MAINTSKFQKGLDIATGAAGLLTQTIQKGASMADVPEENIQEEINDLASTTANAGSYRDLLNKFNTTNWARTNYNMWDLTGMSGGEAAGRIALDTLGGAAAGAQFGTQIMPGIGTAIGAVVGGAADALSSGFGWLSRKVGAHNNAQKYNYEGRIANELALNTMKDNAINIGKDIHDQALYNRAAFGGALDTTFTNGVRFITEGGSHEQNPLGGVFQGIASDGIPNLVEEGEVFYNYYVYSKRLKVPQSDKESLGLKKDKEYTYADAAKQIQKESEERPNDPISKRNLAEMMGRLQGSQEALKEKKDGQALKRAVNKMTPDELSMFMQQLQQPQQMQPMMAMQGMQPMQPTQSEVPMFGKGGYIFKDGGIKDKVKEFIHKFYTPKFQNLTPNEIWNLPYTESLSELPKGFQYIKLSNNRGPGAALDYVIGDSIGNDGSKWAVKYTALSPWYSGNGWALDRRAVNLDNKKEENRVIYVPPTDKSILWDTAQGEEYGNAAYKEFFAKGGLLGHLHEPTISFYDPQNSYLWVNPFEGVTPIQSPIVGLPTPTAVKASDILSSDKTKEVFDRAKKVPSATPSDEEEVSEFDIHSNPWAQALRAAPVFGSLAGTISTLFDKPNYSTIRRSEKAAAAVPRVSAGHIGQRMSYIPVDINYIATQQANQGIGARRALNEYGAGPQAIIANNYANQTALGQAIMQANQLNRQNLAQTLEFNRGTDSANITNDLQAALANQQRDANYADFLFRTGQLRDAELGRVQNNRSVQLTNLAQNLGNLGTDMLNRDMARAMAESYGVTYNPYMQALLNRYGSKGGKLNTKKGGKDA